MTTTSGTMVGFNWSGGGTAFSGVDGVRVRSNNMDFSQIRAINNTGDGLELAAMIEADVHNSELTGNGSLGIRNGATAVEIAAAGNWWGDASGPLDPTDGNPDYNPDGLGQPVGDYVDYRPWMASAPINSPPGVFQALLPGAGEVFQSGPVQFTWSNSEDPDGDVVFYSLEISRTAEFDDIYLIIGGLTDLNHTIDASDLEPNHTSWWRVIARDGFFNQPLPIPV